VALDGLSVYVNAENRSRNWTRAIGGHFYWQNQELEGNRGPDSRIVVYSRENSSGTYEFFKDKVLKGRDFVASAQTMPGTAAVLQAVAKDKNGIGYGGAAYGAGAKHLSIKKDAGSPAVEPTEETVVGGTYPIGATCMCMSIQRWTKGKLPRISTGFAR